MLGVFYLSLAVCFWTLWAVLSARMGERFSPLNSLLWTGLVSALLTGGGFVVHFRQLRLPSGADWVLLGVFCAANIIACFGYYAALRHMPSLLVLPLSHLYLILGPLLLAFLDRRPISSQQLLALCVIVAGIALFLTGAPAAEKTTVQPPRLLEEEAVQTASRLEPQASRLWASASATSSGGVQRPFSSRLGGHFPASNSRRCKPA